MSLHPEHFPESTHFTQNPGLELAVNEFCTSINNWLTLIQDTEGKIEQQLIEAAKKSGLPAAQELYTTLNANNVLLEANTNENTHKNLSASSTQEELATSNSKKLSLLESAVYILFTEPMPQKSKSEIFCIWHKINIAQTGTIFDNSVMTYAGANEPNFTQPVTSWNFVVPRKLMILSWKNLEEAEPNWAILAIDHSYRDKKALCVIGDSSYKTEFKTLFTHLGYRQIIFSVGQESYRIETLKTLLQQSSWNFKKYPDFANDTAFSFPIKISTSPGPEYNSEDELLDHIIAHAPVPFSKEFFKEFEQENVSSIFPSELLQASSEDTVAQPELSDSISEDVLPSCSEIIDGFIQELFTQDYPKHSFDIVSRALTKAASAINTNLYYSEITHPPLNTNIFQAILQEIEILTLINTKLFLNLIQWQDQNTMELTWGILAINASHHENKSILFIAKDASQELSFRTLFQDQAQELLFFEGGSYYRFAAARHLIRQAQNNILWDFKTFHPDQCKTSFNHVISQVNTELANYETALPFYTQENFDLGDIELLLQNTN